MTTARLRKLHPITVGVLILSAAAMVVIAVPGLLNVDDPRLAFPAVVERPSPIGTVSGGRPDFTQEFEHGWPFTYMRRAKGYSLSRGNHLWPPFPRTPPGRTFHEASLGGYTVAGLEVSWTAPASWPLSKSDLSEFYVLAALADAAVAAGIVLAVTVGCKVWLRRRGSIFRWRTIDFIAVITVVAAGLAYWKSAGDAYRRDVQVLQALVGAQPYRVIHWRYRGPEWLARLLGSRDLLREFDHVVKFRTASMANSPESWRLLGTMSGLERVEISDTQPSKAEFSELLKLPRLETVSWGNIPREAIMWLPRLPHLRKVFLWECDLTEGERDRLRQAMPDVVIVVRPF